LEFLKFYDFFLLNCIWEFTCNNCVDVELEKPPGMLPIAWQVQYQIEDAPYEERVYPIIEMEWNLEVITQGILEYVTIDDVSLWY